MPFPICAKHATKVFVEMRERYQEFTSDRDRMVIDGWEDVERARAKESAKGDPIVYYVLVGDLLKIGMSRNVRQRMTQYPPNRKLLATERGDASLEKRRHREFANLLTGGNEWFRFEGALVEHVKALRASV